MPQVSCLKSSKQIEISRRITFLKIMSEKNLETSNTEQILPGLRLSVTSESKNSECRETDMLDSQTTFNSSSSFDITRLNTLQNATTTIHTDMATYVPSVIEEEQQIDSSNSINSSDDNHIANSDSSSDPVLGAVSRAVESAFASETAFHSSLHSTIKTNPSIGKHNISLLTAGDGHSVVSYTQPTIERIKYDSNSTNTINSDNLKSRHVSISRRQTKGCGGINRDGGNTKHLNIEMRKDSVGSVGSLVIKRRKQARDKYIRRELNNLTQRQEKAETNEENYHIQVFAKFGRAFGHMRTATQRQHQHQLNRVPLHTLRQINIPQKPIKLISAPTSFGVMNTKHNINKKETATNEQEKEEKIQEKETEKHTESPNEKDNEKHVHVDVIDSDEPQLFDMDQLPVWYDAYEWVVTGYRNGNKYSIYTATKSIFEWHNETLNIWTELFPAFFVFYMNLYLIDLGHVGLFNFENNYGFNLDNSVLLSGWISMIRSFLSAFAHCYHFINEKTCYMWWTIDYVSIIFTLTYCAIQEILLIFYCFEWNVQLTIVVAYILLAVTAIHVNVVQMNEQYISLPEIAIGFVSFVTVAFLYLLQMMISIIGVLTDPNNNDSHFRYFNDIKAFEIEMFVLWNLAMFCFGAAVAFKSIQHPEKLINSKKLIENCHVIANLDISKCNVDFVGASHQIWHILVNIATILCVLVLVSYLKARKARDTC